MIKNLHTYLDSPLRAFGWIILSLFVWSTFFTVYNAISQWLLVPLGAKILNLETTIGSIIFIIVLFGISSTVSFYATILTASFFNRTRTQAIISASITAFLCISTLITHATNPAYWGISIFSIIMWYVVAYKKGKEEKEDIIPSVVTILITIGVCVAANIIVGVVGVSISVKQYAEAVEAYEVGIQEEIDENKYNYVVDTSTGIFHKPECSYAPNPTSEYYLLLHDPYGVLAKDYKPCDYCL